MIRIVGLRRSPIAEREFVLLQNQGNLRISLRGHIVLSDAALRSGNLLNAQVLVDDEFIPAGAYVALYSGPGVSRWSKSQEGYPVYLTFMNRPYGIWCDCEGPVHLLARQHTYKECREPLLLPRH